MTLGAALSCVALKMAGEGIRNAYLNVITNNIHEINSNIVKCFINWFLNV